MPITGTATCLAEKAGNKKACPLDTLRAPQVVLGIPYQRTGVFYKQIMEDIQTVMEREIHRVVAAETTQCLKVRTRTRGHRIR